MTDLERLDKRLTKKNKKHRQKIIEIVDAFNEITSRSVNYSTKGSLKLILYWLNEGYDVAQFKGVFEYKYRQFKGTDNEMYISIDTFCRESKFENSLENARWDWLRRNAKKDEPKPNYQQKNPIGDIIEELTKKKST